MKAMRAVSQQDVLWVRPQWWRRAFDVRVRAERLSRFSQEQSTGNTRNGALWQFAQASSRGRDEQRHHRLRRAQRGAGGFPHEGDRAIAGLQYGCRRACRDEQLRVEPAFHVPAYVARCRQARSARFAVVAAGTAGLNDLVLLVLSAVFPALMGSGTLGANVLKLGAILGAMALSFFGMRFWVLLGKRLSTASPAKARSLPSSP